MSEQRTGRVVKWIGDNSKGWGLINSYLHGAPAPDKFFFHISSLKTPNCSVYAGLRVAFTPGPPRSEKELPTAQDVHSLDAQTTPKEGEGNGGVQ